MSDRKKRRPRRKFTPEFKADAVRLVLKEKLPVSQVAGDLDVHETSLRGWVKQAKIDTGSGAAGALTTDERAELARLRKELRIVKEEREILKKAAAFFAKECR